jgi:hypothetical protein
MKDRGAILTDFNKISLPTAVALKSENKHRCSHGQKRQAACLVDEHATDSTKDLNDPSSTFL